MTPFCQRGNSDARDGAGTLDRHPITAIASNSAALRQPRDGTSQVWVDANAYLRNAGEAAVFLKDRLSQRFAERSVDSLPLACAAESAIVTTRRPKYFRI